MLTSSKKTLKKRFLLRSLERINSSVIPSITFSLTSNTAKVYSVGGYSFAPVVSDNLAYFYYFITLSAFIFPVFKVAYFGCFFYAKPVSKSHNKLFITLPKKA
jgi:hypothetical protein